jgi:Leucine rich repeat/Secretion system C-terminal sorting domain
MKKILALAFAALLFSSLTIIKAQTNTQDSLALVDLYNGTNGASWTDHTNWLTAPVSTWFGITVSAGRVKEINLVANNLTGTLNTSIGNLSELDSLTLIGNYIGGSLPSSLGNLSKLVWLDLTYNSFTGTIPASLATLANLDQLSLSSNNLSGTIPVEFGNFAKLTELDIAFNNLTGSIPSSLGNLLTLAVLNLEFNNLTGPVPSEIAQLTNLKKLFLDNNNLSGPLPSHLNNLAKLSYFNLSANQLTGNIPEDITNKVNISFFNLSNNNFTGPVPVAFGNCTSLAYLWLNNNQLSGSIPSAITSITSLQSIWLHSNKFNFDGMEAIAQSFSFAQYAPQAGIKINYKDNTLSATAGGTLANNTYNWYRDGGLIASKTGDSTQIIFNNGKYSVAVTNSIASQLTLYSDTIDITTLPVYFINFAAVLKNNDAVLNWKTAQEINVSGYHVQRSFDGIHFNAVATVKPNGSNNYSFNDIAVSNLGAKTIYYRIEESDADGQTQLSETRTVDIASITSKLFVYPNPANALVNIRIPATVSANSIIILYNAEGKTILNKAVAPGQYATLNLSNIANGNYALALIDNGAISSTQNILVQH